MTERADSREIQMTGNWHLRRALPVLPRQFVEHESNIVGPPLDARVFVRDLSFLGVARGFPAIPFKRDESSVRKRRQPGIIRMRDGHDDVSVTHQLLDLRRVK